MASEPSGMLFGWWVIKDASSGHVSTFPQDFGSADNPLTLRMDKPIGILAAYVGKWEQLPDQESDKIIVQNVIPGQRVSLVDVDGGVILSTLVTDNLATEASFEVPQGKTFRGRFQITAPDGENIVYESQTYEELKAGNVFFY